MKALERVQANGKHRPSRNRAGDLSPNAYLSIAASPDQLERSNERTMRSTARLVDGANSSSASFVNFPGDGYMLASEDSQTRLSNVTYVSAARREAFGDLWAGLNLARF
jgi:hypothetical protein